MPTRTPTTDLLDRLREGIATLTTSAQWTRWLDVQRRFHRYSCGNALLVLLQCPTATRVAGYRTWQSLGRQVRGGERGIAILAPITRRRAEDADDEPAAQELRPVTAFRPAYVFDPLSRVSHTALTSRAIVRDRHSCDCRPGWEAKAFIAEVG